MIQRFFSPLFVSLLFAVVFTPCRAEDSPQSDEELYELQMLLVDTLDQVERHYVKDIDRRQLIEAAIKGVLRELDPYSSYIQPENMKEFRTSVESEFGGIGIRIDMQNHQLTVLSPLYGTPAYKAGILAGDRILEIDGKSTKGISIDQAVDWLKGDANTKVDLAISHHGSSKKEDVTLVRKVIRLETVVGDHHAEDDGWDFMLDDERRIGYVRVSAFSRGTARELRRAVARLQEAEMRGLVLDLRFNPGGLLSSAIEVSDMFVHSGRIVSTKGRGTEEKVWDARERGTFVGFDMVVLVNRYSASASEIVSACLQDHGRAIVMGERTWGKGSVQNVIQLEHGDSALKLTTASYHRPSGKNIHRFPGNDEDDEWGVHPDDGYEMRLTRDEITRLNALWRQRAIIQHIAAETPEDDSPDADTEAPEAADSETVDNEETATDEKEQTVAADFVDPQVLMALEYFDEQLARAE